MKNYLIALLDQTYPGVNNLFSSPIWDDGSQKWVDFATSFWHVDCVRVMSRVAFVERYRKRCKLYHYYFNAAKAEEIHADAKEPLCMLPKAATAKFLIQQAISQLNAVSETVEGLRLAVAS